MKNFDSIGTLATLAVASQLTVRVAEKVLGSDMPVDNKASPLNQDVVLGLTQSAFQKEVANKTGM